MSADRRLLSSCDVRLGHSDVSEIRKHPFFSGVDWTKKPSATPQIAPQPLDLGTLAESFVHDFDDMSDITFDHFFASSPGLSMSMSMSVAAPPAVWERWVGWSWSPPADFFGEGPPVLMSPTTQLPIRQHSAPPAGLFTPLRGGFASSATPGTVPRTAPRSCPRTRPVSERRAYAQLVQCVQASARKKLASSAGVHAGLGAGSGMATGPVPGSAETVSSQASGWGKEHPPTPTPMSRESSSLASLARRSRTPSLMGQHSRTPSLGSMQSGLTARSTSRTASRASTRSSRDDTFLSRLTERAESDEEKVHAFGISPSSGDPPVSSTPVPSPAGKPVAGLPKRLARREPLSPLAPRARSNILPFVPPTHPGGKGLDTLETWHCALKNSLGNLEARLEDMQARYPLGTNH